MLSSQVFAKEVPAVWDAVQKAQPIEYGNKRPTIDTLYAINYECNKWFETDKELYGFADYWATPTELESNNKGDCEDFAICKLYKLRKYDFGKNDVRLVMQSGHMFTEVILNGTAYQMEQHKLRSGLSYGYLYKFNEYGKIND